MPRRFGTITAVAAVVLTLTASSIFAQPIDRRQLLADLARFEAELANRPNDPDLEHNLGVVHAWLGHPNRARRHFLRALHYRPNDLETRVELGRAERLAGDLEAAVQVLDRLTREHPHRPDAWFELALALADLGRFDAAIAAFDHVTSLEARGAGGNRGWVQLYAGILELAQEQPEAARKRLPLLRQLDGRYADTLEQMLAAGDPPVDARPGATTASSPGRQGP